jgi:hypothetical protein
MRTDREMTALFAGAIADEAPDPTFLDELFEVLLEEVAASSLTERPWQRRVALRLRAVRWPLLVAAGVAAVLIGLGVVLRPSSQFGGPSPSPTVAPSVTPAPTQPVAPSAALTPYRSPRHGYAIAYPSNWKYHSAPGTIDATTYPYDFSGGVDYFSATSPTVSDPGLIAAGPTVPAGTTLTSWITTIENMQATTLACPAPDATEDVTIGGDPGRLLTWNDCPEYLLWAGVVHGSHAYEVLLIDQWAVANPALQATDKALFLRILTSITFGPGSTPAPSSS